MQLTIINNIHEVTKLNAFVRDACKAVDMAQPAVEGVILAVEEAVVNVMNYAYPEGTEGFIHIKSVVDGQQLTFEIIDHGEPFDPTTMEAPDLTLPKEERKPGGLGIFLMRHYMNELKYERVDESNLLRMTKNLTINQ